MSEADKATQSSPPDDDEALRKRLLTRVAIAGGVVVILLGSLALFDALYVRTEKEPPARVAAAGNLTHVEPKSDEKPIEKKTADDLVDKTEQTKPAEIAAEPELSAAPLVTKPERSLTVPAQPRPAMMRPGEPIAAAQKPSPAQQVAAPSIAVAPTLASRPIAAAVESAHRFLVQMGVFSNAANAEELRAKLELAGLPTQIETRVQVGPFTNKREADVARQKLKALGMEPGLLMAVRK